MADRKKTYTTSDSSKWERRKPAGAPPLTTSGDKRAFDARPKPTDGRSRHDARRRDADPAPADPFDAPDGD